MDKKIIPFEKLSSQIEKLRARKKNSVIVLCHGCFDIVHPGHIRHLKFAREQGSFLIVSITPDVCIQKGSSRPYVPQDLRAENLAALEFVDTVVVSPGETGIEAIETIKPDIYVKGSEYAMSRDPRFLKEKNLVKNMGGKVAYSSGDVVFSSSEFIREHEMGTAETEKLNYICKRYSIGRKILDEIIKTASKKHILIVGETILDEYKYCEGLGIAQESPVLSLSLKNVTRFVGGAGSLALHLAGLGCKVTFLTSVNPESKGAAVFQKTLCDSDIEFININDDFRSLVVKSHYFVDNNQVLEMENGPYSPLDSNLRSEIVREFKKQLKGVNGVILSDFGYGLLSEDLVQRMSRAAKKAEILLASDITQTLRTNLDKFTDSNIFTITEMELRSCLHDYENGLSVLVDRVYNKTKIKELYLMLSDGSALFFKRPKSPGIHNMESAHIPSLLSRKDDRMGKSEAFLTGVMISRVFGANPVQSMYLGTLFGAIHSRSIGNRPLDIESIFHLLDERKEL